MNKCAFVIPLHPKHYHYGYYIFNELLDMEVDLYFVFTDHVDKDLFVSKIHHPVNFLILSDFVDIDIVTRVNSFVSIKKLYALSCLYEKYDYISCIDSEIQFINKTLNFYDVMAQIVKSKVICCGTLNKCDGTINIVKNSLTELTDPIYHEKLGELSKDFTAFTWWCNLPVYDCKLANQFLTWINFSPENVRNFNWNIFDDMTYNFFCILFDNYELKFIKNCHYNLEFSNTDLVEYINENLTKLFWVNNHAYRQNKKYYHDHHFLMVYHLDRFE